MSQPIHSPTKEPAMNHQQHTLLDDALQRLVREEPDALQRLIEDGPDALRDFAEIAFNIAMKAEREQFIGAGHYQRSESRRAYANGYQSKRLDTTAGTLDLLVPKTAGHDGEPFYPQSLERGMRSTRAIAFAVYEMYVTGVSTRRVQGIMEKFNIRSMPPSTVSRYTAQFDEQLKAWRTRPLGETPYVILDARYEKVRVDGVVRDAAVLSAVGVGTDGQRTVLGVSAALTEAAVHWRAFLDSLVERGLRGARLIVSDDHAGLKAARTAVFGGVKWQRCQFHIAQNAIHQAPSAAIRERIGDELRAVWNALDLPAAQRAKKELVAQYLETAPKLAEWLDENVDEGLTVFTIPRRHRRRLRTTNVVERGVNQEIKRRTRTVRVFPSMESLLRLVTALAVEIDEKWTTEPKAYIRMEDSHD